MRSHLRAATFHLTLASQHYISSRSRESILYFHLTRFASGLHWRRLIVLKQIQTWTLYSPRQFRVDQSHPAEPLTRLSCQQVRALQPGHAIVPTVIRSIIDRRDYGRRPERREESSRKGKVAPTWKMNDESDPKFLRISSSRFRHFHFYPPLFHSFVQRTGVCTRRAYLSACVRAYVRVRVGAGSPAPEKQAARRAPTLERVSPRSTDENGVCRRRSSAGRSGTDKTSEGRIMGDTEKRERERQRDGARGRCREGGYARRCTPRRPYRGKVTAWKTTSRQRPRPGLDGRPVDCSERKKRDVPALFFDAARRGPRIGIWKAPGGWAKYAKLVNATEVNTREESAAENKEADARFKGDSFDVGVFTAK